jgi:hypothetical protein
LKWGGINKFGWFTLMVGPQGVKNVEALKGLKGPELATMIRLFGPCYSNKFSDYTISILI